MNCATVANTENASIHLPRHIGIIMDGNGRWASRQSKPRSFGHKQGLENAKTIVHRACEKNIPYLSLFVFSTENWKRSVEEVGYLMNLIDIYVLAEMPFYRDNNIQLRFSGDLTALSKNLQNKLHEAQTKTKGHSGLVLNMAINYGGKNEIIRAIRRLSKAENLASMTEEDFKNFLDNPDIPDIDFLIRTAGDMRTSNFFIWQSAYAELYFNDKLWPDWKAADFDLALNEFTKRNRRYGGN
jgi:undecaprenyl diphosphate synthase